MLILDIEILILAKMYSRPGTGLMCAGLYEVMRGRETCCIINVRKCKTDSTSDKNVFKCVTIWHF